MSDLAELLNTALYGFTEVVSMEIVRDDQARDYPTRNLRLVLENSANERIELRCMEICNFKLNNITQISFLRAEDVRSHHLDRVTFKFKDQEIYEDISFACFSAEVKGVATKLRAEGPPT